MGGGKRLTRAAVSLALCVFCLCQKGNPISVGIPTVSEWEAINDSYLPVVDNLTDWVFWSCDFDPYALDLPISRTSIRNIILDKLSVYAEGPYAEHNANIVRDGDVSWNRLGPDWIMGYVLKLPYSTICKYLLANTDKECSVGSRGISLPTPAAHPIEGLVESAKKCFPAELWQRSAYDIRRFALEQAEAIAASEVDAWPDDQLSADAWFGSMFRVGQEMAKWLHYPWRAFLSGTYDEMMQAVGEALYNQEFTPMVRAQTEDRYIPQPTSFPAPVLPRVPPSVEAGGFDLETVKPYVPFVGIGIGLFRILRG